MIKGSILQRLYEYAATYPSDINEHLPYLLKISSKCSHITEMGVRSMVSTWAMLRGLEMNGSGTYIGIDIEDPIYWGMTTSSVASVCKDAGINYEFKVASSLEIEIEPTDFLFIDTIHEREQLKKELELHAGKVRKFIGFHDTKSCPEVKEVILEFIEKGGWSVNAEFINNNGLMIIEKHG